jgi:hypothetical protein
MRAVHYVLAGSAIAAMLAISVALVVRDLPAGKPADQPTEISPQATAPAAPKATPEPPAVREPAPISPEPLRPPRSPAPPVQAAPTAPAQAAKPGNLFDIQSMPSPGYIGPDVPLQGPQARATDRNAARMRLKLTPEQSARVSYVLLSHTITQTEAPEFPLRIGSTVPPEVLLTPLPRDLADAVPDYEHYSYIIVQYQIVIVVSGRREIDLLIPI